MVSEEHVGQQFRLHGIDVDGAHFEGEHTGDRHSLMKYAQEVQGLGVKLTEHSHEGTCEDAGCKVYERWRDGDQSKGYRILGRIVPQRPLTD